MKKKVMIYTCGESLMDIILTGDGQTVAKPGGSQLNVAVSLGRAGKKVAMVTEIGNDRIGQMLTEFLAKNGVATKLVKKYPGGKTSLAIASLDKHKKPAYSFYKMYPEKRVLQEPPAFKQEDVFIFGSMYSCDPAINKYMNRYLENARKGGAVIVYDPNVRHIHPEEGARDREILMRNLASADIIKGSDEDYENIFGPGSLSEMKDELRKINDKAVLVITLGAKGSVAYYRNMEVRVPAPELDVVSTIGAGDAFTAGLVNALIDLKLSRRLHESTEKQLRTLLEEGTRFSSLVCRTMDNYIST